MEIKDRVYGSITINEPVLLELINSKPLQRLKGINQAGASQYAIANKTVTRYEHSLGVMLLLRKLSASLEEQIAGLLHDTPHTAFSHVIDFVFKSEDHDFHEKFHEKIIMNSEVPAILEKNGFIVSRLFEEKNFPLLERTLPDLCADRIDYSLRDMVAKDGYEEKITIYLQHFILFQNEIIIDDRFIARRYAEDYLKMDEAVWSHPLEIALFQILADAIRIALQKGILVEEDLFSHDAFVYEKLKDSKDREIRKKLSLLSPKLAIADDPKDYDFYAKNKLRYINPKCYAGESIKRVSEIFPDFQELLNRHNKWVERGNYIKIISPKRDKMV
ncbi:MAG TPA: HD domain-containing protein [Candidatus Eremiobacteraeota bacterium]|nr:MAG: HD domain protein [bacterium ADurb.Bin363]HPZ07464.1 HD domain-containing protein [Candidatus Eremiobacteraeota bacterium]